MDQSPYSSPLSSGGQPPLASISTVPKTIGILNIVFGSLLLLFCGLCQGGMLLFADKINSTVLDTQQQAMESMRRQHDQEVARLEAQLESAATDAEKQQIETQITFKKQHAPPVFDSAKIKAAANNPTLKLYGMVEVITGIVLNVALLLSGLWLIKYRAAGRTLALGVMGLKIGRLVVSQLFNVFVILPVNVQLQKEMLDEMGKSTGGPNPFAGGGLSAITNISGAAMAAGMVLIGSIYPAIVFWQLLRPEVKAACNR